MPKEKSNGFTLIELIMVIVVLGILSIYVSSKYFDLKKDAAIAHADGVFSAAQMAASRHFSKKLMGVYDDNITQCSDLVNYMEEDPTEAGWQCSGTDLSKNLAGNTFTIRISTSETNSNKAGLCCTWTSENCPQC